MLSAGFASKTENNIAGCGCPLIKRDTMRSVALGLSSGSPVPVPIPRLLLIIVFVLALGRRLLNWFLAPLRRFGILEEPYQYPYHDLLTLWTRTDPGPSSLTATTTNCFPISNPLQTIRETLPAVVEYGSLAAGRCEDIICSVCLSEFVTSDRIRRLAGCGHVFHTICLDKWIDYQRYSCPLCRSPTF